MQTEQLQSPDVLRTEASAVRGRIFEFGGPTADQSLYAYQVAALNRIESVATIPRSGIVHFPTGAGKTRVGIEVIARAFEASTASAATFIAPTPSIDSSGPRTPGTSSSSQWCGLLR